MPVVGFRGQTTRLLNRSASLTAQMNAAQRAAESLHRVDQRLLDDSHSRYFVSHPVLRAAVANQFTARLALRGLEWFSGGLHGHIIGRTRYAREAIATATRAGIDQVVLLGAGFDITSLHVDTTRSRVFELDAPTTQEAKRAVIESTAMHEDWNVVWVSCDFESDSLLDRLRDNGFNLDRPAVVVWLGVSMYLTFAAMEGALRDLRALCAPQSILIMDYIDPDILTGTSKARGGVRGSRLIARRGEPYRSGFSAPALDDVLKAHGFTTVEHLRSTELVRRYDPHNMRKLGNDDFLAVLTAHRADDNKRDA